MEFVWFAALAFVAYLILRTGFRLWKKEAEARKALGKKIADDAAALVKDTEAWLEEQWNRKFKGGTQ